MKWSDIEYGIDSEVLDSEVTAKQNFEEDLNQVIHNLRKTSNYSFSTQVEKSLFYFTKSGEDQ